MPGSIFQSGVQLAGPGTSSLSAPLVAGTNATVEFGIGTLMLSRFVPGTVPALFEHREDEIRRCQRYALVVSDAQMSGPARTATSVVSQFLFPEMYGIPAPSLITPGTWWVTDGSSSDWQANPVSILFQSLTVVCGLLALDEFSGLNVGRYHIPSATRGTARILLSADI